MNRILAIAALAVRSAVRSKILIALAALLALAVVGIPLTVEGDGTIDGEVQILLRYTLGAVNLILSMAAVWAGCGAVALEIQDHQLSMVTTKPVRRLQIWLGKWMGLLALNALLVAFAGGMTLVLLRHQVRSEHRSADDRRRFREEILVARSVVEPDLPAPQPAGESGAARLRALTVPPHERREWNFRLPPRRRTSPATLQFHFSKSEIDVEAIHGRWILSGDAGPPATIDGRYAPLAAQRVTVPAEMLGGPVLRAAYENAEERSVTVLFDPDGGLELLVPTGGFAPNVLRALLVLLCRLTLYSAVGLAAGSLFSLPVASFVAVTAALLFNLSGHIHAMAGRPQYVEDGAAPPAARAAVNRFYSVFYRAMDAALRPLERADVLALVSTGREVPWRTVGVAAGADVALYGGLLALAGAHVLRRRELGLPT